MRIIRQTGWRSLFSKFLLPYSIAAVIGIPHLVANADDFPSGYDLIRDDGTDENRRGALNLIGAGVSCADDSANNETECTIAGGSSGNSFETIDVPAGTDPVADSATDTLTLTSTGATVTITGNSGTDTINLESTAGSGDISAVGDCATGACFTGSGTSSTQLTFDRPTTDITFGYVASTDDIELTNDLNLYDVEPHLSFYDTTTGADDYHFYADQSEFHLTNLTDNVELFRFDNANKFRVDETTLVVDRTNNLVGIGTAIPFDVGDGTAAPLTITDDGAGFAWINLLAGDTGGTALQAQVSDGTVTSPLLVDNNEAILKVFGLGWDGDSYNDIAGFSVEVDAVTGNGDTGGRFEIHTTADGSDTPTQRVKVDSAGNVTWQNATVANTTHTWSLSGSDDPILTLADGLFTMNNDLDIEDPTPHLRLTDTTGSQDDFEIYADGNQIYLTNVTDSRVLAMLSDGSIGTHARTEDALFRRTAGIFCPGTLSTSMDCEDSRVWIPANCTVQSVRLTALTAPTTQAIIVDVNECDGSLTCTTIDTATKPQIAAGATTGNDVAFTDTTLARGNYLGFDLDQVGSGTTGADLTVTVECLL